ncbi:HAD-IIIA family hydrolase [bacterium]|nr:MAG: HAD-IIIA family hydrolase [bacterium]
MNKAFFLDRDGTLNEDYDFVHLKEEWTWCKGAIDAIKWMNQNKYKVIVVTNQSGIARGRFSLEQVQELHRFVDADLKKHDAWIDDWCIAWWHPKFHGDLDPALLDYRKPGTRFFTEMIHKYNLDPAFCFMAGDKPSDLKPALSLGMKAFYIKSRFHETNDHEWLEKRGFEHPFNNLGEIISSLK